MYGKYCLYEESGTSKHPNYVRYLKLSSQQQGIFIDILANNGVVPCILPYMSAQGVGGVIQSCLCLAEAIVFGSLNFMVHIKDTSHL